MHKKQSKNTGKDDAIAGTSESSSGQDASSFETFFDSKLADSRNELATSATVNISFHPTKSSPEVSIEPNISADSPGTSAGPSTSSGERASGSGRSAKAKASSESRIQVTIENLTPSDIWAQYVRCLTMAPPANLGRVEIEQYVTKHAEKYLDKILKLTQATSKAVVETLRIPCFEPEKQDEISGDENYKVEILKAIKTDGELIWNTAAQLQALVLIKRSEGTAIGLEQLRSFNLAFQEAADAYRESFSSDKTKSVGRAGNFQYRISYAGKTEIYHAEALRSLILQQLPKSIRYTTEQTKSERLKDVLQQMKQKRSRKQ